MANKDYGLHAYQVSEANNLALGQNGSICIADTNARYGRYVAITFLADTVFTTLTQLTPNRANGLAFTSGGTAELMVGDTIRGNSSGAEAAVESVVVTSGSWISGNAAGYIIMLPTNNTEFTESETVSKLRSGQIISSDVCTLQTNAAGGIAAGSALTGFTFYSGLTIFGVFSCIQLASGKILAYKG